MVDRKGRGGRRSGAGRPSTGAALRSLTVRLTPEQIGWLRVLGDGNASLGVRRLLDDAYRPRQNPPAQ